MTKTIWLTRDKKGDLSDLVYFWDKLPDYKKRIGAFVEGYINSVIGHISICDIANLDINFPKGSIAKLVMVGKKK